MIIIALKLRFDLARSPMDCVPSKGARRWMPQSLKESERISKTLFNMPAKRGITRDYMPSLVILQGMTLQITRDCPPSLLTLQGSAAAHLFVPNRRTMRTVRTTTAPAVTAVTRTICAGRTPSRRTPSPTCQLRAANQARPASRHIYTWQFMGELTAQARISEFSNL